MVETQQTAWPGLAAHRLVFRAAPDTLPGTESVSSSDANLYARKKALEVMAGYKPQKGNVRAPMAFHF